MGFDWFVAGFLVFMVLERVWETRASHHAVRGEKRQRWSLPLLFVLHVAVMVSVGLEHFCLRRGPISFPITAGGLVLFTAALVLRNAAIRTLGNYWSLHVEVRHDHPLIQQGPYRYMRHPAYAAIMMEFVAIPLVANSYSSLLLVFLLYFPVLALRMVGEERVLVEKFGNSYLEYRRQVCALLPLKRLPKA